MSAGEDHRGRARNRGRAVAQALLGVGLFALVLWWIAPDWAELAETVQLRPAPLLLAFVGTTLASLVTAARWKLMAEGMDGTPLPFVAYLHGLVLTRFLGQFVPTLAMDTVGRGVALRSAGSERGLGHAVTQVAVERLLDVLLPVVLVVWAILSRGPLAGWALPSLAVAMALFAAISIPTLPQMVRLAIRLYWGLRRWSRSRGRLEDLEARPEVDVPVGVAAQVCGLSMARFATVTLQFLGIAWGIGLDVQALDMLAATPIAQIASLLGVTPGALGIQEAGWAGGLHWVGASDAEIALFVLAQRALVAAFFGLLAALTWPLARAARGLHPRASSATPSPP